MGLSDDDEDEPEPEDEPEDLTKLGLLPPLDVFEVAVLTVLTFVGDLTFEVEDLLGSDVFTGAFTFVLVLDPPEPPPLILTFTPPDKPRDPFFSTVDPPLFPEPKFLTAL